jgi:flagellar FliL protein
MADEAAGDGAGSKSRSKLLILTVVGGVLLVGGGAAGAWMLGLVGGTSAPATAAADGETAHGDGGAGAAAAPTGAGGGGHGGEAGAEPIFVDLPHLLVNLVSDTGGTRFLKLSLAVEVGDQKTADRIDKLAPRIVDSFQLYLRTLTPDELRGPGSMFRLKEDLHVRIHRAIAPAEVRDVLFKEMLVQ